MICNYNSPESIQWPHTPGECFSPPFVPGNSKPINFTEARSRTRLLGPGRVGLSLLDHLPPQCVPRRCDEGHWDKGTGQWPPGPGRRVPAPLGCPARGMPKSQEGGTSSVPGLGQHPSCTPVCHPAPGSPATAPGAPRTLGEFLVKLPPVLCPAPIRPAGGSLPVPVGHPHVSPSAAGAGTGHEALGTPG